MDKYSSLLTASTETKYRLILEEIPVLRAKLERENQLLEGKKKELEQCRAEIRALEQGNVALKQKVAELQEEDRLGGRKN